MAAHELLQDLDKNDRLTRLRPRPIRIPMNGRVYAVWTAASGDIRQPSTTRPSSGPRMRRVRRDVRQADEPVCERLAPVPPFELFFACAQGTEPPPAPLRRESLLRGRATRSTS